MVHPVAFNPAANPASQLPPTSGGSTQPDPFSAIQGNQSPIPPTNQPPTQAPGGGPALGGANQLGGPSTAPAPPTTTPPGPGVTTKPNPVATPTNGTPTTPTPTPVATPGTPVVTDPGNSYSFNGNSYLNLSSSLMLSMSTSALMNSTAEALRSDNASSRENKRAAERAHQQNVAIQNGVERASISHASTIRAAQPTAASPTFNTIPSALLTQIFRDAARQSPLASSGEGATRAFAALRDTNTLALPNEIRSGAQINGQAATTGIANLLTNDEGMALINNTLQALMSRQLSPQDILQAFALTQSQFVGTEWFTQGARALTQWLSMANIDSRAALASVLAEHLTQMIVSRAGSGDSNNAQRALLLNQLASIANDPDLFARLFAGIGDAKQRATFLHQLAVYSPGFGAAGQDAFAALLMSIGAREGSSRASSSTANFDQLRGELLQFMGAQSTGFFVTGDAQNKQFHTQRMEGVLQCIIQHLMRDFSRSQHMAPQLRRRYANSIDLLSSLLELLEQESEDDARRQHYQAYEEDEDEESNFESPANEDDNWEAALRVRYQFRVAAGDAETVSAQVRWEQHPEALELDLPEQFDPRSPFSSELEALHDACSQEQFFATPHRPPTVGGELLREVIQDGDGVYGLGAAAVGETLLARQWTCKMWANDLASRLDSRIENEKIFPFAKTYQQLRARAGSLQSSSVQPNDLGTLAPRSPADMRLDMLRMLSNSADEWARKLAGDLLEKHLKARNSAAAATDDTKRAATSLTKPSSESGQVKELIQIPDMRNAAIYFLAQYYFRLEKREQVIEVANHA
jgi:hypothetical protein